MVAYYVLGAIAVVSIGLSIWGTVAIWQSGKYDRRQKFMQLILVWVLPYVGAVLVLYFAREPTNLPADFTDREMRPENVWWGIFR